jgi:hypothetical protein
MSIVSAGRVVAEFEAFTLIGYDGRTDTVGSLNGVPEGSYRLRIKGGRAFYEGVSNADGRLDSIGKVRLYRLEATDGMGIRVIDRLVADDTILELIPKEDAR